MRPSSVEPSGPERTESGRATLRGGWFEREPELLAGDRESAPRAVQSCQHNRLSVSSDRGLRRVTCACGVSWLEIPL
jgi:hypothetical protein